jgi:hypothetical protein
VIVRFKRFHLRGPSQIVVRDNEGRVVFEAYLNGARVFVVSKEPIHDAHDRQEFAGGRMGGFKSLQKEEVERKAKAQQAAKKGKGS